MTTPDTTITVNYIDGNEDFHITVGELDVELADWMTVDGYTDIRGWDAEELQELRDDDKTDWYSARVLDAAIQRAKVRPYS